MAKKSAAAAAPSARKESRRSSGPGDNVPLESEKGASSRIDERIRALADWRGETLSRVRRLIHEAVPQVTEEWKWRETPVWSHAGIICTGESYKQVVKLTFARGAALPDPKGLFNSSLEGTTRRAIDLREGEKLNATAFKSLIRAAVKENLLAATRKKKSPSSRTSMAPLASSQQTSGRTILLSGGNPQIPKGDGDAPVQAYLAAMPGWKKGLGQELDALIVETVPEVEKAVRWNSPFYGTKGHGWFLSFHVFTRYVKVTFFNGMSLKPVPPGGTERSGEARWIDIYEDHPIDRELFADWIRQAAALPGWKP